MPDREQRGLRGPVKSCTEQIKYPGGTDAEGKTYPESRLEYTTEYDSDGRVASTRHNESDGIDRVTRNVYDASGRLLTTTSGKEGQNATETVFSYDNNGKLVRVTRSDALENPTVFHYDEKGRKTEVQVSRAADQTEHSLRRLSF
jgi:YD repeat-containing protein